MHPKEPTDDYERPELTGITGDGEGIGGLTQKKGLSKVGRLAAGSQFVPEMASKDISFEDVKAAGHELNNIADKLLDEYGSLRSGDINAEKLRRSFEFIAGFSENEHMDTENLATRFISRLSIANTRGRVPTLATEEITALEDSLGMLGNAFKFLLPAQPGDQPALVVLREFKQQVCPTKAWDQYEDQIRQGTKSAYTLVRYQASQGGDKAHDVLSELRDVLLVVGLDMEVNIAITNHKELEVHKLELERIRKEAWRKILRPKDPGRPW